ncbi:YcxB family protein [Streptomyces sp. WMMC897]|uniref:YcxB family protein n=1 Tax=Streptomyces sp. WMMC897 TaxID=3014782 RepID=UPI0022B6CAEF|nr:YcxB family protein [Streptomyces sp. WMMC897]MCZ7414153.1 YcxB family protein [Streptomyces sp. WMMC897]
MELTYQVTRAEIAEGLRLREGPARTSRGGAVATVAVVLLLAAAAWFAFGPAGPVAALLVCFGPVAAWLVLLALRSHQVSSCHRIAREQGEWRAVLDAEGFHATAGGLRTDIAWSVFPRYAESERVLMLFDPAARAKGFLILPKRAIGAGRLPAVRRLLDEHPAGV